MAVAADQRLRPVPAEPVVVESGGLDGSILQRARAFPVSSARREPQARRLVTADRVRIRQSARYLRRRAALRDSLHLQAAQVEPVVLAGHLALLAARAVPVRPGSLGAAAAAAGHLDQNLALVEPAEPVMQPLRQAAVVVQVG